MNSPILSVLLIAGVVAIHKNPTFLYSKGVAPFQVDGFMSMGPKNVVLVVKICSHKLVH